MESRKEKVKEITLFLKTISVILMLIGVVSLFYIDSPSFYKDTMLILKWGLVLFFAARFINWWWDV